MGKRILRGSDKIGMSEPKIIQEKGAKMMQLTIPYLMERCAFKFRDTEAIVSETGRWTFHEWKINANKRAHALQRLGIRKGDHVATLFLNGNEVLEIFMALMKIGAIIVPLNMRLSPRELIYIINHSDAEHVIYSGEFHDLIEEIKKETGNVRQYIISGGKAGQGTIGFDGVYEAEPGEDPDVEIKEEDTAFILYTAGTTGKPKGVVLSHKNLIWSTINLTIDTAGFSAGWRVLLVFPLYHSAAVMLFITAL
jgi:acyl-CoA synthetase (AMP-forming)/AMP-acid ligase II